jgi:hypothetical protein
MKWTLAFGFAMLLVLLALTLSRPATGLHRAPGNETAVTSSDQDSSSGGATCRLTSATQTSQQSKVIDVGLLAAVEAETDPDRRSEGLERLVQSVADADLPVLLETLAGDPRPAAADLR